MQVKVDKKPKSTLEITITISNEKVKDAYAEVLKEEVSKTTLPGFRKGQAPQSLVEENLNPSDLNGEIVNRLLQTHYPEALKQNKIQAVSNPKVEIKEFNLEKDFEFTATVATKPDFKINEYKKDLVKLYKDKVEEHKDHDHETHLSSNEVIELLVKKTKIEVPDLLVDEEVERMIMRLLDQTQAMGMSFEDFLKAQNKTTEQLRDEYKEQAAKNIKAEFILQQLIDDEKVEVSEAEIEEAINAVGDKEIQKQMQTPLQKWYIKSVLAKNKLLSNIIEEAEASEKKASTKG